MTNPSDTLDETDAPGQLVPSISVANLVNQRAAVIDRLDQAVQLIREAAAIAGEAHLGMPRVTVCTGYGRGAGERNVADARLRTHNRNGSTFDQDEADRVEVARMLRVGVDASAWQYLMHESGLRTLMDATARKKWDDAIGAGDIPELTEPNIRSTFGMLHDSRSEMFDRGVVAIFKGLSWDYKTNLPHRFGKRIVQRYLRSAVSGGSWGSTTLGHPSYQTCDKLDDLVRVFHVLDGKTEPDHRQGWYSRLSRNDKTSDAPRKTTISSFAASRTATRTSLSSASSWSTR